jgi:hypothetical protein
MTMRPLIFVLATAWCRLSSSLGVALSRDRNRLGRAPPAVRAARVERTLAVPRVTLATTLVGATSRHARTRIGSMLARQSLLWAPLLRLPPLLVVITSCRRPSQRIDKVVRWSAPLRLVSFLLRPIIVSSGRVVRR